MILARPMGQFSVVQRTVDGFFNATKLLEMWNKFSGENKRLDKYLKTEPTQDFIEAIQEEEMAEMSNSTSKWYLQSVDNEGVSNTPLRGYLESVDNKGVTECKNKAKLIAKPKVIKTTRGNNGGTWMHPLLFIDFAMWLNRKFKVKVLKFVQDELIEVRLDSVEAHKKLSSSLFKLYKDCPYLIRVDKVKDVNRSLNAIVYGVHKDNIRSDKADLKSVRDIFNIQTELSKMIDLGFIDSENKLRKYLKNEYLNRNPQQQLLS